MLSSQNILLQSLQFTRGCEMRLSPLQLCSCRMSTLAKSCFINNYSTFNTPGNSVVQRVKFTRILNSRALLWQTWQPWNHNASPHAASRGIRLKHDRRGDRQWDAPCKRWLYLSPTVQCYDDAPKPHDAIKSMCKVPGQRPPTSCKFNENLVLYVQCEWNEAYRAELDIFTVKTVWHTRTACLKAIFCLVHLSSVTAY